MFYPPYASAWINPRLHSFVAPPVWADWWGRAQWDRRNCWAKLNVIPSTTVDRSGEVGVWVTNIFGKKKKSFFKWIDWSLKKLWSTIRAQSVSARSPYPLRSSAAALIYVSSGPHVWQTSSDMSCVRFLHHSKPLRIQKRQSNPWKSAKNAMKQMFCTPHPDPFSL